MKNKKQLKIALITGAFPTISETFVVTQVKGLIEAKQKVDFYCLRFNTFDIKASQTQILKAKLLSKKDILKNKKKNILKILKVSRSKLFLPILKSLNIFKYGLKAINGTQLLKTYYTHFFSFNSYNIIHIHFADNAVYLLPLLRVFKGKIIVTFHGYDAHKYNAEFYKALKALPNVSYTVNTHFTKTKIMALGFAEAKINILPVGLNTSFFKPSKTLSNVFNIVFVGRLIPFKAPLLAIEIFERLIKKGYTNCHLHIVGSGEQMESCKSYISKNKLENIIDLHGNMSQNAIKDIMNISNLFLFPGIVDKKGRCENQGLVIQEAQSMQLPVLVSDVGGIKDGLMDKVTGFVLPEKDIEAFVSKIAFLIDNKSIAEDMGKKGRVFVQQNYDNKILVNQVIKIYNQSNV